MPSTCRISKGINKLFRKKETPAVTGTAIKETRVKDVAKKMQG